jgi:hypothetical protein
MSSKPGPFRADWFAAQWAGEARTFAWYVDRARRGDRAAAARAIEIALASMQPEAVQQAGGVVDSAVVAYLAEVLEPATRLQESELLRLLRAGPTHRQATQLRLSVLWWAAVETHQRVERGEPQEQAAANALEAAHGGPDWRSALGLQEDSFVKKHYRPWRAAIAAFLKDGRKDGAGSS